MTLTFQELIYSCLTAMGLSQDALTDNSQSAIVDEIKRRINAVQDYIFFSRPWNWRRRTFYMTTVPPYTTGTIDLTQGSRAFVGSGTAFSLQNTLGELLVNSKLFKISDYVDASNLKLISAFPDDTATGKTYSIVYPDYFLNPNLSSLLKVKVNGNEIDGKGVDNLVLDNSTGTPEEYGIGHINQSDFYTDGSVAVTQGSTAVVGTGTSWASYMEGMPFRVNEFSDSYVIKTVTDATHIVLDRDYNGNDGSGKSYKIGYAGASMIRLSSIPDDYYWVEMEGLIKPFKLVNNNDISLIPIHAALLHGSLWFATHDFQNKNPVRVNQAKSDFEDAMRQLEEVYGLSDNVKWTSAEELQVRRNGGLGNYDPFSY